MKNKNIISFITVVIIFIIGFFLIADTPQNLSQENIENIQNIKYLKIAGVLLKIEVASTVEAQAKGLSGRSILKEDAGMLFVFDQPGNYGFWMKDMNFAIDMIWLAEDGEVVYIKKDARPESYPEIFNSDQDAKYILEVVAGFSEKNNLKEGDRVEFVY